MIRHVILRTLRPEATAEGVTEMERRLRALEGVPGVGAVVTGRNLGLVPRDGGFDHVTTIELDGPDALRAMVAHPLHAVSAEASGPVTERSVILDVPVEG
jgi:hypothetical protein